MAINVTTPVGRIVMGELWKLSEKKDAKGAVKIGADGKPEKSSFFALAIAKVPGHTHWAQTEWGRPIWDEGNRAHPNFAPHPNFSWKIEDGDSAIPNKKGKKNCEREGHPGHWILKCSSMYLPKTYNADGSAPVPAEAFKTGYFAQVCLSVRGNTGDTPGVYLNPSMVALAGYGAEIVSGPDVSEAGFGAAPLPVGASAVPLSAPSLAPVGSVPLAAHALPPLGAPQAAPSPLPLPTALPVAPAPVAVPPNPAFLAGPPPLPVAAPAPAPVAPAFQMTAAAQGFTRDQYLAQGWTDAQLREKGMML